VKRNTAILIAFWFLFGYAVVANAGQKKYIVVDWRGIPKKEKESLERQEATIIDKQLEYKAICLTSSDNIPHDVEYIRVVITNSVLSIVAG